MCGIAGWLGVLPNSDNIGQRLATALKHRGPDLFGVRSWAEATLVHTRLSIIDLSPSGSQPMSDKTHTVWTVFNGEIYNHRQLRTELENQGHSFRGHSDTEILPYLYKTEGQSFLSKLRGMFAFAIFDTRTNTLLLARDRFGIKPLFYSLGKNYLAFGSEINALAEIPDIDFQINRQSLYDLAGLSFIPAPETVYTNIQALQPGELIVAQFVNNSIEWKRFVFHRWSMQLDYSLTLDKAIDITESLLSTGVQRQLESDVPLGTLLSGGIDSSLISVEAQAMTNSPLRTFNARFSEETYDETWAAVAVANHVGSNHHTLHLDHFTGTWEEITNLLLHAGQPFADTSIFGVHKICRAMREYVTVALSGDGGDEGFGGYNLYWRLAQLVHLQKIPAQFWKIVTALIPQTEFCGIKPEAYTRRLQSLIRPDNTTTVQSLFSWMSEDNLKHLCWDQDYLPIRRFFEPQWINDTEGSHSRLERLSGHLTEINTRLILANDFLFKVDTASMKESLEIRVPMLDEDLFTFGLSLPHKLKVEGKTCKRVLRGLAQQKLPPAVANKAKRGFAVPVDKWVNENFKSFLSDTLLNSSSRLSTYYRPEIYQPIVRAFCKGESYKGLSRKSLYRWVILFLSVHLVASKRPPTMS